MYIYIYCPSLLYYPLRLRVDEGNHPAALETLTQPPINANIIMTTCQCPLILVAAITIDYMSVTLSLLVPRGELLLFGATINLNWCWHHLLQ